ncbi:MAG: hypothetical protein ACMXYE_02215 [Candidatus Woesearchaeota archaeon]
MPSARETTVLPMTHLPLPFGPRTTLKVSLKGISVRFAKLLNPCRTSLFIFVIFPPYDTLQFHFVNKRFDSIVYAFACLSNLASFM